MKTALLLLAIICCAALTRETCIAEPPSNPASEQVASGNREKTIDPKKTLVGVDLRQTKAVNDPTLRVRSSAIVPLTKSSPKNLRSHGPSPAIIGGPATAFRNTAAINGTAVKRNP